MYGKNFSNQDRMIGRFQTKSSYLLPCTLFFLFCLLSCAGSPEETLERIAAETRTSTPLVMDESTTMTGCQVLPNRTLKFTYKVKGVFTEPQKGLMAEAMKKVLLVRLKERNEIEFYLINNVRFEHLFMDANNNVLMNVQIEAMEYK